MTTASVPKALPFAAKDTEPVGLVPNTDAVNVIAAPGVAVANEVASAVVLVRVAGLAGGGLVWFNNEMTYGALMSLVITAKTSSLLSFGRAGA